MSARRKVAFPLVAKLLAEAATAAPDPIFAAIEAHRAARTRVVAFLADNTGCDLPDDLGTAEADRLAELLAMTPTTPAGCAAMMQHIETYLHEETAGGEGQLFHEWTEKCSESAATLLGRLAAVLVKQAGT